MVPDPPLTWPPILALAVVTLVGGGAIGYAIGDSTSNEATSTVVSDGGAEPQTTTVTTTTSTSTATNASEEPSSTVSEEPFVLKGASDQTFDQRSFSGDYKVTWSYKPNSAPFLDVGATKTANPDALGKTVVSTEADHGTTFVNLEGDYYINVFIGGKDYTIEFEPQ